MGGFANSVHLKANDLDAVEAAIRKQLVEIGGERADNGNDAIQVSQPRNGWIGLFDSQFFIADAFYESLTAQLDTHALQIMVHDSDSWHYRLFSQGKLVDSFDSIDPEVMYGNTEGIEDDSDAAAALATAMPDLGAIESQMQAMQAKLEGEMPEDIRAIRERMSEGNATQADLERHSEWMTANQGDFLDSVKEMAASIMAPGALAGMPGLPKPEELAAHAEHLQPLLPDGTTVDDVVAVMSGQSAFAEMSLGKFLKSLGIAETYAHLDYRDTQDITPAEQGIMGPIELGPLIRY